MAVTSGFFPSSGGDRKYSAEQMGSIFDGVISDGIYQNYGKMFAVRPTSPTKLAVYVDSGRAWFTHTWVLNDATIEINFDTANSQPRIDIVVIEINKQTRLSTIKAVKGTASSNPTPPLLPDGNGGVWQRELAQVTIRKNATTVTASDIKWTVGQGKTPFVTAPMQTLSIDAIVAGWDQSFQDFMTGSTDMFQSWFNALNTSLQGDVAANLAGQIAVLQNQMNTMSVYSAVDGKVLGIAKRPYIRDNNLGSSVTSTQKARIADGSFTGLFVGDYWTINGIRYRIVDIDYWYGYGDPKLLTHHVVLMPDQKLSTARMHNANSVAYARTEMAISGLNTITTNITSIFGVNNVLLRSGWYDDEINKTDSAGGVTNSKLMTTRLELPTETMLFGSRFVGNQGKLPPGPMFTPARYGHRQLAYFQTMGVYSPTMESDYWTRDAANQYAFVGVNDRNEPMWFDNTTQHGVRPIFALGGM